jgi:uncharacterized iron-regulated protein
MILGLALSLSGCVLSPQPTPPATRPGVVLQGNDGRQISWDALAKRLDQARVVLVGEVHDHPGHHQIQRRILELMSRPGEPPLTVGVEWLDSGAQEACDRLSAGRLSLDEFAEQAQWKRRWGYRLDLYRPVLELVRGRGLRLVALNAATPLIRQVAKEGLNSLTPDQRAGLAPSLDLSDGPYRRRLAKASRAHGHMRPGSAENFFTAQVARDETMAHNLAQAMIPWPDSGRRAVVLVGGGHLYHGEGLPPRIKRRLPGLKLVTIMPASPGSPELASLPPQGPALADYLVVSDPPPPRPPRLGVFLERASGGLLVKMVRPASPAAKAGMQSGDFLTKVDGKAVKEVKDIHNVLKLTPYETHVYTVSRMGRVIKLNITLLPDS